MSAIGKKLAFAMMAVAFASSGVFAQPTVNDIPPIERNAEDFYHAIAGNRPVVVTWEAEPSRVPLGGDIALSLIVEHSGNPTELLRPDLRKSPAFTERFQILESDVPPESNGSAVRFTYLLRPRTIGEIEIPSLKYRYYRPAFPLGKRMQTTYARPITVSVTPPPPKPAIPITAPEALFTLVPDTSPPRTVPQNLWLISPVLAVFSAFIAAVVIRRFYPDAARRMVWLRNRAAREALRALHAKPLDETQVFAVVHTYWVNRWQLPPEARTPREIAAMLPPEIAESAARFTEQCDAARFGELSDNSLSLANAAMELIERWEAAA